MSVFPEFVHSCILFKLMVKCVCIFTVIYEEQFLRALSEVLFYFHSFIIVAVALLTGSVSCPGMYCNNDLEETGI